jgi:hypothetical protein
MIVGGAEGVDRMATARLKARGQSAVPYQALILVWAGMCLGRVSVVSSSSGWWVHEHSHHAYGRHLEARLVGTCGDHHLLFRRRQRRCDTPTTPCRTIE